MEDLIYNIIKKQELSKDNIYKCLKEKDNNITIEEINACILNLIKNKKIFRNIYNRFETVEPNYFVTTLLSDSKGNKVVYENNYKLIVNNDDLHTALKYDTVVVKRLNSREASIVGIIKRRNNKFVCQVKEKDDKLYLAPFNGNNEFIIKIKEGYEYLLKDCIVGDRVYFEVKENVKEDNILYVDNLTKIGHFNDKMNDEIAIAITKDFDIDFSKEALEEANNIPSSVLEKDKKNRLDLTDEMTYTIDSISTKDMDDAISIKKLDNGNYLLGVHIADVAYYIKPKSNLFKDALRRGTSVYLGDVVIPMIPSNLSNGICSLNEGVERLTKTCFMEIDKKGKIIKHKIVNSVIKSNKKMTYEELNKYFKGEKIDDSYNPFLSNIEIARELSNIMTRNRHKKGNLDFESNDIKVNYSESDIPVSFRKKSEGESEKMVENFMIAANETVATHYSWLKYPFIYRTHDNPDELKIENTIDLIQELNFKLIDLKNKYGKKAIQKILDEYKDTKEYTVVSNLLLRNMAKAKYSTTNIGHYALALNNYCHFTSPIRRFPDLTVHTLINLYTNGKISSKFVKDFCKELEGICEHSNYKERQESDAEKDYLKLKMAQYMQKHIDEEFEGILLDIDNDKVFIKLNNDIKGIIDYEDLNGFTISNKQLIAVASKTRIKLGTKVKVKVAKVDIPQKEIYFSIKEIIKKNTNDNKKLELKK